MPIKFLNDVAVDTSVLYVDTVNNRVGIGTASPSELLHIEGTSPEVLIKGTGVYDPSVITMSNGSGDSSFITNYNNPAVKGLWLRYDNGSTGDATIKVGQNELLFDVNNGTAMYIDSSRNVGINATSLYSKLHIGNSSNSNNNLLTMESSGAVWVHLKTPSNTQSQIGFGESQYVNQNTRGRIVYNSSTTTANNYMSFTTNFAEVMRITNSNVGIGTTSPAVKLHVGSTSTSGTTTEELRLQSGTSSGNGGTAIANLVTGNFGTSGIYFGNNTTYSSQPAYLQYQDSSNVTTLRFDAIFNINQGASGTRFNINSSGNVGIGTTSPAAKLEVEGGDHLLQVSSLSATGNPYISFNQQGVRRSFIQHNDSGDYLKLASEYGGISFFTGTGGTETQKMTILSGGNVGIGTDNPVTKLEISGPSHDGNFTSGCLMIQQQPQGDRMFIDGNDIDCADGILFLNDYSLNAVRLGGDLQVPNGDVGIGTTSPGAKLDVDGSFKLSDFTSTSVATTGSLSPNQNYQAPTQDTLADLTVDPSGNVVRGSQEGTWTFTKAQIDALTTSTTSGTTLIAAPGANKAIIVEESNLMIKYSGTGTMSSNSFVIRQAHNGDAAAEITRIPAGQINTIMSSAPANPSYGFYSRDLPLYNNDGRSFVTNKATFLSRINTNATPTNLISISIKLKYRIYDATTF